MNAEHENSSVRCIRAPRDEQHPYFLTARAVAQDMTLSLDERGLLWYILSLPDDWFAHPMQLGKANGVRSKDKVYRLFKSLMKAGYCERKNIRKNGRHDATIYMFYEEKQQRLIDLYKEDASSFPENRNQQDPDPVPQESVKQDITDNTSTTNKKKKKRSASLPSIEFDYEINQFVNIQDSDIADWKQLYAGVNLDLELGKMRQWLMDPKNPERDGNRTFITNWLSRAQKEVAKTPRKPSNQQPQEAPLNANGSNIPYNSSIAYSILHEKGVDAYVDYLKSVNDLKYYNNYLNGKYEKNYLNYLEEQQGE